MNDATNEWCYSFECRWVTKISQAATARKKTGLNRDKPKKKQNEWWKGAVLKGPAVTYPLMVMHRKDKGIWSVGELKGHPFWEATQTSGFCSLNSVKLELREDFFPGRICKPFACKRNYFVLQSETTNFACWKERNVECINVTKWITMKRNYFIFSYISLTVRLFNFLNLCSC